MAYEALTYHHTIRGLPYKLEEPTANISGVWVWSPIGKSFAVARNCVQGIHGHLRVRCWVSKCGFANRGVFVLVGAGHW